jgi:TOMM system kinase/cyclase fusion protein
MPQPHQKDASSFEPHCEVAGYTILGFLGEGGAGSVFKASQASTGQSVAIKMMHQNSAISPDQSQRQLMRFERETLLCAQMNHPHIVKLLDKGYANNGQLFAVFEYVPGETLKDRITRIGALGANESGELMGQILDALACAHEQGIAHRDLKPQNIMISSAGTRLHAKILDFGIAAMIGERQMANYRNLTMTEEMICSPSYSAPEHLRGEPPSVKIDLYAWGLLFLECLTGRPAIEGSSLADIFHQQLSSQEVALPPGLIGHPLADLLRRVLRKKPQERAAHAHLLYQDFQKINLSNIVGDLSVSRLNVGLANNETPELFAITREFTPGQLSLAYQRQQISVLSCNLSVVVNPATGDSMAMEPEALEALQADQLSLCMDTAARYGGYLAGSLGTSLLFYFGYPHAAEDDARRAARTALELTSQARRRNALLAAQGLKLVSHIGLHTGMVRILTGHAPTGLTPNTALQLGHMATPGTILASNPARKILGQFLEFLDEPQILQQADGSDLPCFSMLGEKKAEAFFLMHAGRAGSARNQRLIGREAELAQLAAAWQRTLSGHGQSVLLCGEAGIGKSRLAYEFCVGVRNQGCLIHEFRCLPEYQNNALHPILEMLKAHLHLAQAASEQEAAARLHTALKELVPHHPGLQPDLVLPILCSWLALPCPEQVVAQQFSPERQKTLLLSALCALILHKRGNQPILLVVEDLHWIDPTSVELLAQLQPALAASEAMLLISARPEADTSWARLTRIEVANLPASAAAQLIDTLLGGKAIAPEALQRLVERTDGIPLFIEELTRMLLEQQLLLLTRGVYTLDARFERGNIPVTLRDLLSARLSRLGSARETAQLAAAIGREFHYHLLAQVTHLDEGSLQNDLDQLLASDVIYLQRQVQGDSYIFRHALIRDCAYDAMPAKVREPIHARIALEMSRASGTEIESVLPQLVEHFAKAQMFEQATQNGLRAAQIFHDRALFDNAITLLERIKVWINHLPASEQSGWAIDTNQILLHALMLKHGYGSNQVKECAEQALTLVQQVDDPKRIALTLWTVAFYHHFCSHRPRVHHLLDQLAALADKTGDQGLMVACQMLRADTCWLEGRVKTALQCVSYVLQNYEATQQAQGENLFGFNFRTWGMGLRAEIHWFHDNDDAAAFALVREGLAYARSINHIPTLGSALGYLIYMHQYAGQSDQARTVADEMLLLAQQYDLPTTAAYATIFQCWANTDLATIEQVLANMKEAGCKLGTTHLGSLAAEIEAQNGHIDAAMARIEACLLLCDEIGEQWYKPELLLRRAKYRPQTSAADKLLIQQDLQQALALAEASGMKRCSQRAQTALTSLNATQ